MIITRTIFIALLIASFFTTASGQGENGKDTEVNWLTVEEAMKKNQQEPRKIFVDIYTDWCGWCKRMDKTTFTHPVIVDYLNNKFYAIKFDAESKEPVKFSNKTFVNEGKGKRPTHQFAIALLQGKMSYPSTAYLDEKMQYLGAVPGYKTPQQLEEILAFFATGAYNEQKYSEFLETFESKIKDTK